MRREGETIHKDYSRVVGSICRYWRKERGCTMISLAQCMGVTSSAVYKFEKGCANTATFLLHYIKRGIVSPSMLPSYEQYCRGMNDTKKLVYNFTDGYMGWNNGKDV